jgi:hypothetical protein
MQAFVNGWLNQARRHDIPSELIIVEWNPPPDRPRLAQALRWPEDGGPCAVRIIEVPPEVHSRYPHGSALPLYQMIGKNVGIRRARGKFVLATNIDILFSSELAAFLAQRTLDTGRMYRIDRHDVMSDVPVDADPEDQLAYCRTHLIRINRREGTFPASSDGSPSNVDGLSDSMGSISGPPGGHFGLGWYAPERYGSQKPFRWATADSLLLLEKPPDGASGLVLEVEPGPGTAGAPVDLEALASGESIGRLQLTRRSLLHVRMDWGAGTVLRLLVHGDLVTAGLDPRKLPFRLHRLNWETSGRRQGGEPSLYLTALPWSGRIRHARDAFDHLVAKLAYEAPLVHLTVLISPRMSRILKMLARFLERGRLNTGSVAPNPPRPRVTRAPAQPVFLHTNACGDFTLLANERWCDLRGYPEFDLFSMNLDSVFCYTAHHGGAREELLADPMRIYHIEHGTGSGWTPEGQERLYRRITDLGLSYIDNETVMQWAAQMRRFDSPFVFNREDWGLAALDLPETLPLAAAARPASPA